ncbi:MAG: outer membrane protein transport protein [Candidatus Omnitrophica bacterium]|nr:outer membrane protein transport protein [Candidatus Omnitrophota bacterium]
MSSYRYVFGILLLLLLVVGRQEAFAGDSGVIKLELSDAAVAGMGGAYTAQADRPSAVYYNPAGIVQMSTPQVSAGLTLLQPQIEFKSLASGNGNTSSMKRDNYLFPAIFVTSPVMKDKLYLGFGENSNFGAGNDWAADSFSRYDTVKDSIENQDYMLVAAYKINSQWSLGVGAVDDQSKFEHDAAVNNTGGLPDGDALFKAADNAWGFKLGAMFKLNDQNQFGIDYKSPIHHTYDGTLYLNGLSPFSLGSPGFFGSSSFTTRAIQKLTLPQSVTLGYSFKPTHKWILNFDLEWTDWSQYKQQTTFYPDVTSASQIAVLSTGNPQPRDWTSVWSESLGVQYAMTDKLRIRGGYSHHQTPVPEGTFDTEFPDSDYNAYTTGFGYDITKNLSIDVGYVAVFYQSRNVVNSVDTAEFGTQLSGKYREFVNIGTATLTYKF